MCRGFMGCVIVFFNIFYLITGLTLMVIGGLMSWTNLMKQQVIDLIKQYLRKSIPSGITEQDLNATADELWEAIGPAALAMFCVGVIIFLTSIIAFIGVCCHVMCMLILYAVITGLLVIGLLILVIIYRADKTILMDKFDDLVEEHIKKYEHYGGGNTESKIATVIMQSAQCCGYKHGNDFSDRGKYKFNGTDTFDGLNYFDTVYPIPCCKEILQTSGCPKISNHTNSNFEIGCKGAMETKLRKVFDVTMNGVVIALVINMLLFGMVVGVIILRRREISQHDAI